LAGARLLERTAALVRISSVSGNEASLAELVAAELRPRTHLEVVRVGDNVVARQGDGPAALLLAGHLDTVPPAGERDGVGGEIDGGVLSGLGAVDMKGGLAILLALAASVHERSVTYVFYAREEIARRESGLLELAAARPDLLAAEAAVLLEPTGGCVEAGCQGVIRARVTLRGTRAHTARPWTGRNAIHRLAPLLARAAAFPARAPAIEGCTYREALEAVDVRGGVAGNVVPDEAQVLFSHRFAPDRSPDEAVGALRTYLEPALDATLGDRIAIEDVAPAAAPGLAHGMLASLVAATGAPARAKLGWTDVAFFTERGVPAANFGPGDPLLAHSGEERLSAAEVEAVARPLAALLDPRDVPLGASGT
jgi:succinyl-diaminopimelate desuccinylase